DAVADEGCSVVAVELVLGGRGDRDVACDLPHAAAGHEACRVAALGVLRDTHALDLLELLEQLEVDTGLIDDVAGGVGCGDGGRTELLQLLDCVNRDVARARHDRGATVETLTTAAQHLL